MNKDVITAIKVAPLTGAWIEIQLWRSVHAGEFVAPLTGAWIEM